LTPIKLEEMDNIGNKRAIEEELEATQKELAHTMLFINLSKNLKNVKPNDFLPYYDPTYEDRIIKIQNLKNRILQLRHYLDIKDDDVSFYVEVRNATFPQGPLDIVNHLNESYYYADAYNSKQSNITNGRYKNVDDIYKERNSHLSKSMEHQNEEKMLKALK